MIDKFTGPHTYLSNFYPWPVAYDGVLYPSVEHAYQAAKTVVPEERARVLEADTAGAAKRQGKRVTLRDGWDHHLKLQVMLALLRQKFAPGTILASRLLATAPAILVEGNNWGDTYWGVCQGSGQNWLGRLLMKVRLELGEVMV